MANEPPRHTGKSLWYGGRYCYVVKIACTAVIVVVVVVVTRRRVYRKVATLGRWLPEVSLPGRSEYFFFSVYFRLSVFTPPLCPVYLHAGHLPFFREIFRKQIQKYVSTVDSAFKNATFEKFNIQKSFY